ncbi:MAG: glycosyltransferase family 4 protein [Phycisphaerales bacterium]|nr:MAG: glycosyltransferase family 4 protein [Phycisphaerales bacterium]
MLNYEFPPIGGGAAKAHLCLLRQYTKRNDLQVDVLTSAPKPGAVTEKFSENITIHKVGIHKKQLHYWRRIEVVEWLIRARFHYRRLLRQNKYDLVHAFFGFPTGWLCYRTAGRLPYVISLRGSDVPGQHARFQLEYKILGPVFRAIWKKAASIVACSEGLKARALRFLPSVSIEVIPNGVELDRFSPAEDDEKPQVFRLLTVGRLSVTKRVELLIDAVEILHKQGYDLRFTVVGGGSQEPQLRAAVLERNLEGVIEITGRMDSDDMPQLYRRNDIFVSASIQEGMSNAMLEAMASGLPIVTTRCEGLDELIADNGLIVEQANAGAIAKAIQKLADDRSLCRQMSLAARKQAERFGWSHSAEQYLTLYDRLR